MLRRDAGIDVALSTINDAVLRVGELLIPIVAGMARDLLTGGYIQADETYCGVQTPDKKGENHSLVLAVQCAGVGCGLRLRNDAR